MKTTKEKAKTKVKISIEDIISQVYKLTDRVEDIESDIDHMAMDMVSRREFVALNRRLDIISHKIANREDMINKWRSFLFDEYETALGEPIVVDGKKYLEFGKTFNATVDIIENILREVRSGIDSKN